MTRIRRRCRAQHGLLSIPFEATGQSADNLRPSADTLAPRNLSGKRQERRHCLAVRGVIAFFHKVSPTRRVRSGNGNGTAGSNTSRLGPQTETAPPETPLPLLKSSSSGDNGLSCSVGRDSVPQNNLVEERELRIRPSPQNLAPSEQANGKCCENVTSKGPDATLDEASDVACALRELHLCCTAPRPCRPGCTCSCRLTDAAPERSRRATAELLSQHFGFREAEGSSAENVVLSSNDMKLSPSLTARRRASFCGLTRLERISLQLVKSRQGSLTFRDRAELLALSSDRARRYHRPGSRPLGRKILKRSHSEASVNSLARSAIGPGQIFWGHLDTQWRRSTSSLVSENHHPQNTTTECGGVSSAEMPHSLSSFGSELRLDGEDTSGICNDEENAQQISPRREADSLMMSAGNCSGSSESSTEIVAVNMRHKVRPRRQQSLLPDGYHPLTPQASFSSSKNPIEVEDNFKHMARRSSFSDACRPGRQSSPPLSVCTRRLSQPVLKIHVSQHHRCVPAKGLAASLVSAHDRNLNGTHSRRTQHISSSHGVEKGQSSMLSSSLQVSSQSMSPQIEDGRDPALGTFVHRRGRYFLEVTQSGNVTEIEWQGPRPVLPTPREQPVARGRFDYKNGRPVLLIDSGVLGEPIKEVVWTGSKPEVLSLQECRLDKHLPEICTKPWYFHGFRRQDAEVVLASAAEGTYLIRPCNSRPDVDFALTIRHGNGCVNFLIPYRYGAGYVLHSSTYHPSFSLARQSLGKFVEALAEASRNGNAPWFVDQLGQPLVLERPALHVPSLQDICRATVRKHVRRPSVSKLPLPRLVKNYLKMNINC